MKTGTQSINSLDRSCGSRCRGCRWLVTPLVCVLVRHTSELCENQRPRKRVQQLKQEAQLSPSDRAMRLVSSNLALIESYGLKPHLYADDTQVYGSCPASDDDAFSAKLTACSCAVASWMQSTRLQLNSDKTEVLWCATTRRQHQLPRSPLLVDWTPINPV